METNQERMEREHAELVRDIERLVACYQLAASDDKAAVWDVLNKYTSLLDE